MGSILDLRTAARPAVRADLRGHWRSLLAVGTAWWVVLQVVATTMTIAGAHYRWGPFSWDAWYRVGARFDTGHYLKIIEHGYQPESPSFAFFPAYPLLVRGVAFALGRGELTRPTMVLAAHLVSMAAGWVLAVAFCAFVRNEVSSDENAARRTTTFRWACLLFFLGPFSVFLFASYAEPLFLAFAVPAWLACRRGHYVWAGALGFFSSLTRVTGCFMAVAMCVLCVQQLRAEGRPWFGRGSVFGRELVATAVSGVGGFLYLAWVAVVNGSPTAYFEIQNKFWGRVPDYPWNAFKNQLIAIAGQPDFTLDWPEYAEMAFTVFLYVALLAFLLRRAWPEAVFLALPAYVLTFNSRLYSVGRNTFTLFPVYPMVGGWLARVPLVLRVLVGAISVVWFCWTAFQYGRSYWAG